MLASKDENHVDPLPSVGTPQTLAEMNAELGDSQDAEGLVQAWGPQEQPTPHLRLSGKHSAGGLALFVPPPRRNPGECQINDKTHFTSRPEVCSGESELIAYLIWRHRSLIQASTNNSVLRPGSKGLMGWAFHRALFFPEPLLTGS